MKHKGIEDYFPLSNFIKSNKSNILFEENLDEMSCKTFHILYELPCLFSKKFILLRFWLNFAADKLCSSENHNAKNFYH